ncbi:nitroreductase [Cohnella sp. GCM10027633]|uniref:nitroreductase family protein n=1 Tax=unclassified Cohnella TaxID=2636738 RepID=UPI00364231E7
MTNAAYEQVARTVRERRTVNRFDGRAVARELMLELLQAAVWAPFHSDEEPWRFILFMEDGRKKFSDAVLLTYSREKREQVGELVARAYREEVPVTLLVVIRDEPRPKEREEALCAASALIQNLHLLAWERGLGLVWKTNDYNWNPDFRRAVGVLPGEHVVGTLHIGYYDESKKPRPKPRTPAERVITWELR